MGVAHFFGACCGTVTETDSATSALFWSNLEKAVPWGAGCSWGCSLVCSCWGSCNRFHVRPSAFAVESRIGSRMQASVSRSSHPLHNFPGPLARTGWLAPGYLQAAPHTRNRLYGNPWASCHVTMQLRRRRVSSWTIIFAAVFSHPGHVVAQWLRHYATSRKVADSRPDKVIEFYQFT
jgi:hypothetical protein